ncbi:hypothetical protein Pan216_20730 [Planctomycetes bacterium Pan216]|uniref:Uncharacterized protein n=1 Tax=Kolteria novifilia TaxID=2527975 RepID=A0A518B2K2_9BACT|nr:hypothetical protein Pan216_20730 [Planctomycetes bacterium Pan216]
MRGSDAVEAAINSLETLGSPKAIADHLYESGIRGSMNPWKGPINVYHGLAGGR